MDKNQNGHSIPTPTSPRKPIFPTLLVIILSILAVAVITGIIIALVLRPSDNTDNTSSSDETFANETSQLVYDAATSGSIENVIDICAERANLATSPERKADVYIDCANTIVPYVSKNESIPSVILEYVHLADELNPTIDTAQIVSFYESRYGDPAVAEEYSKIANERMMSDATYTDKLREEYREGGGV